MGRDEILNLFLRVGVAFAFIYPAVSAFFDPFAWIGFFPEFVRALPISDTLLLHTFGILEIGIALWLLIGKRIFIPSALATIFLFFIVIFNLPSLAIVFRDIPIMLMALALAMLHFRGSHESHGLN